MGGLVAAGHPETAAAAAAVLAEGGNAVDAVLAGLCAACVAEPVLASLGGGGFLLARLTRGPLAERSIVYDFFVQTPKARRPESELHCRAVAANFGPAQQAFHIGLGTVATPGVVRGLFEAHRDLARLPMRRIVEPAVRLARTGVRMNPVQAYIVQVVRAILEADEPTRTLFASPTHRDRLIGDGETYVLPALADTLEILAIEGEDLFYRGEIAQAIAADCASGGGHLALGDLAGYRVERRRPLEIEAFGARVALNPPPSMGGILVAFGLALWQALGPVGGRFGSVEHARRLVAVMRATGRARLDHRADPLDPVASAERLLDPALIARYRAEVLGSPGATRGTTQISVVDGWGGAASASISNGEGAAHVVPGTGVILNNMLGEDDLNPDGLHQWPVDRRMASMMTPALALAADGGVIALGSGGSNRIRSAVLQALLNLLAFEMPLQDAIDAPRLHVEGDTLSLEPGFDEAVAAAISRGFAATEPWPRPNMFFGGVHAAQRRGTGRLEGAGDARRGGAVRIA